ncbi:hypothetical protein TNCV_4208191 [Trichonephila clavipes]|nr:hypothetical protein TNCV_4208191 [Trichonephila clavipes]
MDNYTALNELTVVIKGLPKKAKPEDIHNDLIDLGFTVDRVSQLTGKITNQLLPVFLVSMANLPTDMEPELAESHRNATRTPSPQLTPCEQLKYNKAQLAKMETFRRCKQACVDALMMMPDHTTQMNPSTSEHSLSCTTSKKPWHWR